MHRHIRLFFIIVVAALVCGCVGLAEKDFLWQDESVSAVWPEPPDTPRIQYLRSLTGPADFKKDDQSRNGFLTWLLGESQDDLPLLTPFSVAVDKSDNVWVADNGARMLYRFDMQRRKVEYFQEFSGVKLVVPSGIVIDDARERVYLADAGNSQIFVLDLNGNHIDSWSPPEGFRRAAGLAINPRGQLLAADAMGGIVYVFDVNGEIVSHVTSKVSPDGRFRRPLNVAIGPNDEILVLDAMSFRVEIQDSRGELLDVIGQVGDGAGSLARPKGLAVDRDGHIFISDAAYDNVQVFDLAGNLLMYFGDAGNAPGQFNLPAGLFIDSKRRLFVADSYNHRVQAFSLLY